jgi:ABC-type lipoprotein export system ATPase subunit
LLAQVGVEGRADHKPGELSGGESQRVAIARALFCEPQIVFCDEPTGNLDTATSQGIHRLITDLNQRTGQTFVIVTHDPTLAAQAHRVAHMVDGRVTDIKPNTPQPQGDTA